MLREKRKKPQINPKAEISSGVGRHTELIKHQVDLPSCQRNSNQAMGQHPVMVNTETQVAGSTPGVKRWSRHKSPNEWKQLGSPTQAPASGVVLEGAPTVHPLCLGRWLSRATSVSRGP